MATILVSIICIAMIVVGGIALSNGILTSADTTAISVDEISLREGEIFRTSLDITRGTYLSWEDLLRVTVTNDGQTKLASFNKWDVIVHYSDGSAYHSEWLPYTTEGLNNNEWKKARIGLNGPLEYFEPEILNPGEELVMLAKVSPRPGSNTTGEITVASPNGINDSISFLKPGYTLLIPHSENITIAGTKYYELTEAVTADGATTVFHEEYGNGDTGRKILYNFYDASRDARHVFPLVGISEIPESSWTFHYRCYIWGDGQFPQSSGDVRFNVDILVRADDGSLRTTIASGVAAAYIDAGEEGMWLTKSGTYDFPGYTVENENDYLEIAYYIETDLGPGSDGAYVELTVDDSTLSTTEQTRIES
jgi:archaellum component FlaF (FlaF/FlaG flagellin family)